MSAIRRLALGFPVTWSHRRGYSLSAVKRPGEAPYFVEWDPGRGVYGEDWTDAPFDVDGVLLSAPDRSYHPIRIAQFALHRFAIWYATGDARARKDFLAQALWLRDNQQKDTSVGTYRFAFPWKKYGANLGWCSAMAQGEAISVLLRAESIEPQKGYREAAQRASLPFYQDIEHGGVVWKNGSEVFFEEIANAHAPHVLNGCIFALWGVWELWKRGADPKLEPIIAACVETLGRWLTLFDTGWWTRYSLMRSGDDQPHIATLKYHQFHIAQMRVLSAMFDEPAFQSAAARWDSYIERPQSRARVLGAALRSLPERFWGRDMVRGGAHA
jgi:heparosan-N-sulfate-glucuronate 5-epimerase